MDIRAFDPIQPTDDQVRSVQRCQSMAKDYASVPMRELPDGPDKTYLLRKLREVTMWATLSITRNADGSPRE